MRRLTPVLLVLALAGCGIGGTLSPDPGPTDAGKRPSHCHLRGSGIYALPDARCSPGARNRTVTQVNINSTICKSGWTRTIRPPESVTEPEKRVEMRAYGRRGSLHGYELDHVISLELGGAPNSYKNYYPEPDYPHREGFYLNPKDRLENALKHLVCGGKLKLRTAQHLIASNWVTAYRRYVK